MTPQFEAACISAAILMATDRGFPDPTYEGVRTWTAFSKAGMPLGINLYDNRVVDPAVAEEFADLWEDLTDEQRECICIGNDVTPVGSDGTTYLYNGLEVEVASDCDKVLHGLFHFLGQ